MKKKIIILLIIILILIIIRTILVLALTEKMIVRVDYKGDESRIPAQLAPEYYTVSKLGIVYRCDYYGKKEEIYKVLTLREIINLRKHDEYTIYEIFDENPKYSDLSIEYL